jgi:uncharacterized protein YjdB
VNLTGIVAWSVSSPQIATIGAATGLATAVGQGTATITAIYTNVSGGTVVTGTATFTVSGGTTEKYTAVSITPSSQALSASGQTSQLIAIGTSGSNGLQTDVTSSPQIKWSSNIPTIASVSATGLVTGLSAGTATITAELTNPDGTLVSNTSTVAVSITPAPEPLLSLTIIPNTLAVGNLQGTGNFLAIGTYATAPFVRDLTNSPNLTWLSSFPNSFPVNTNSGGSSGATAGVVTAYGTGSATIIAEAKNPVDGTIQTATATFSCPYVLPNPPTTPGSCFPGSEAAGLLQTVTVYNEGLNTTNWLVTADSVTHTPSVIHCGPGSASGGSVCESTYPIIAGASTVVGGFTVSTGTTVVFTATGGNFGGWSYNCTPSTSTGVPLSPPVITAVGPNYCTVTISNSNTDITVGAIFN